MTATRTISTTRAGAWLTDSIEWGRDLASDPSLAARRRNGRTPIGETSGMPGSND